MSVKLSPLKPSLTDSVLQGLTAPRVQNSVRLCFTLKDHVVFFRLRCNRPFRDFPPKTINILTGHVGVSSITATDKRSPPSRYKPPPHVASRKQRRSLFCPLINESSQSAGRHPRSRSTSSEKTAGSPNESLHSNGLVVKEQKWLKTKKGGWGVGWVSWGWMSDDKCISARWHFHHHLIDHLGDILNGGCVRMRPSRTPDGDGAQHTQLQKRGFETSTR